MTPFDIGPLLDSSNDPAFLSLIGEPATARQFRLDCERAEFFWIGHRLKVLRLAGDRMTTKAAVMNEFEAVLQFRYFKVNWDALSDWIRDLGWMRPGAGYLFLITDAGRVLEEELAERPTLIDVLREAADTWSHPVQEGANTGQPAVPFHFILSDSRAERVAEAWGGNIPALGAPS